MELPATTEARTPSLPLLARGAVEGPETASCPTQSRGMEIRGQARRRILAILFPRFSVERLLRSGPAAVWAQQGAKRVVVSVNADAEAAGLEVGQALADAQAILPDVALAPEDPAGDALALERLALWALRFTPLVGVIGRNGLMLDITGVEHLFKGEAALREEVLARLARMGLTAITAVAGMAGTALALVHAGWEGEVPSGQERSTVAPLSLAALNLEPAMISALQGLGLRSVGIVDAQPRPALARRFGTGLVHALDEALGLTARPIIPIRLPPEMAVMRDFVDPVVTREGIEAALADLLAALCRALREAGRGARRILLRAYRVDGNVQELTIGTGLATRDPQHLARLFKGKLEGLEPDCGFDRLTLEASMTNPLTGMQENLGTAGRAERREELAQLLDRLSQRLPVWRLAVRASHWPERAMARMNAFETAELSHCWVPRPRPVRLLRRPPFLQVMAQVPDGPPFRIRLGRIWHRVRRAEDAERIEPEWWRDGPNRLARDYYPVELDSGARLWVCRSGPMGPEARWVLHGHLP
ncbi:DNA polymerase Y family protein [Roseomonas sp. JC162]|uniref:DNA-directed DNA polymerase n=1 Tax=Neoroseomonas marina TaxID=1232220 RepID=A0A848EKB7_9PROT|nr:DNA polymerase Y family protein [Neoroseomonas marina]NMJ43935.1 DNA polymerase Y family protein [Neoroseomonas marina]